MSIKMNDDSLERDDGHLIQPPVFFLQAKLDALDGQDP